MVKFVKFVPHQTRGYKPITGSTVVTPLMGAAEEEEEDIVILLSVKVQWCVSKFSVYSLIFVIVQELSAGFDKSAYVQTCKCRIRHETVLGGVSTRSPKSCTLGQLDSPTCPQL